MSDEYSYVKFTHYYGSKDNNPARRSAYLHHLKNGEILSETDFRNMQRKRKKYRNLTQQDRKRILTWWRNGVILAILLYILIMMSI